jgi:Flp pilus assembly protein TadD
LSEATAKLDRALIIFPNNWAGYWYRGRAFSLLGNHPAAKKSYLAARDLEPSKVAVGREITNECIDLGDLAEALVVAAATVKLSPQDSGLRSNLALALLLNGRVDEAFATTVEAQRLDPHDQITARLLLAIYDVKSGKRPVPKKLADLDAPIIGGQR